MGRSQAERRRRPLVPAAVDRKGDVFIGIAQPCPYPDRRRATRTPAAGPGPNLYTDSLVALDGANGKLLWYRQVTPHDIRDYDFQDSPIIVTVPVHGVRTEIVVGAGKSGKVIAFDAADGKRFWTFAIGKHNSRVRAAAGQARCRTSLVPSAAC